jgi:hypothetical protein
VAEVASGPGKLARMLYALGILPLVELDRALQTKAVEKRTL